MYLDLSRLLSLSCKLFGFGMLSILAYHEWSSALFGWDMIAHYAHLGGCLGALLYLGSLKFRGKL